MSGFPRGISRIHFGSLLMVLLAFIKISTPAGAETPLVQWEHVYPDPTGSSLQGVAWGPPGFVAIGSGGEIIFSADAMQWGRVVANEVQNTWFEKICFYDGKYFAVGTGNLIALSTNGENWTVVNSETNGVLLSCAGGGGLFAAVGIGETLLVSSNGIDWEKKNTPATFLDIAFGNNMWVAVTGNSTVFASTDLVEWTGIQTEGSVAFTNFPIAQSVSGGLVGDSPLKTICFGDGRFVVGGARGSDEYNGVSYATVMKVSTNGLNWDRVYNLNSVGEIRDIAFANGHYIAALKGHFLRSTNGVSWETVAIPDADGTMAGIAASNEGKFVAVGSNGAMLRSENGADWQLISKDPRVDIQSVAWANSRFVAVGGRPFYTGGPIGAAAILTSTNGSVWKPTLTNLIDQLSAVAYGNKTWVVTGDNGQIFTSRDGLVWADHSLPPTAHDLRQLVYGRGRFIAFSAYRDLIYFSVNGKHWRPIAARFASEIARAKFVNGRFIGVGGDNDGLVFSSFNGVNWKKTTLTNAGWMNGVTYGKGRYVVAGHHSSAVSFNGRNWITYPTPASIADLQYVNGWFVGTSTDGLLLSRDGIVWQTVYSPTLPHDLGLLAGHDNILVSSAGTSLYRGVIEDSDEFKRTLRHLSPAQLEIYGAKKFQYRLEQSRDLVKWTPVSRWISGQDAYKIWNMKPSRSSSTFWRTARKSNFR